jgi:Rad4 transglutaminase-like domain
MPRAAPQKLTAAQQWAGQAKLAIGSGREVPTPPAAARKKPQAPPRAAIVDSSAEEAPASSGKRKRNGSATASNNAAAAGADAGAAPANADGASADARADTQKPAGKKRKARPKLAGAANGAAPGAGPESAHGATFGDAADTQKPAGKKRKAGAKPVEAAYGKACKAQSCSNAVSPAELCTQPSAAEGNASTAAVAPAQPETAAETAKRRRGNDELEAQLRLAMAASEADAERFAAAAASAAVARKASAHRDSAAHGGASTSRRWGFAAAPNALSGPTGWLAWTEAFCGGMADGAWVHVDAVAGHVDAAARVEEAKRAGPVAAYVVACLAGAAKDVTRRYVASWMRSLRERDEKWWVEALKPLRSRQVRLRRRQHSPMFRLCLSTHELATRRQAHCHGCCVCMRIRAALACR